MKRKKERRRNQKPYLHDPPRMPLVVKLPDEYAEGIRQWAHDENRSVSSLIAELLQPVFDEMDKSMRKRARR